MGNNKDLKENLTKNLQSVNAWFEKNHPNILRMDRVAWKKAFSELLPNVNDFLRTYSRAKNRQGEDIDSFKSYNEALIDALNLTWDTSEGYIGNISYQRNKQRVEECIKNIFYTDSITEEVKTIAHILISINQLSPQKLSIREQPAIGTVYSTIAFDDDKNMDDCTNDIGYRNRYALIKPNTCNLSDATLAKLQEELASISSNSETVTQESELTLESWKYKGWKTLFSILQKNRFAEEERVSILKMIETEVFSDSSLVNDSSSVTRESSLTSYLHARLQARLEAEVGLRVESVYRYYWFTMMIEYYAEELKNKSSGLKDRSDLIVKLWRILVAKAGCNQGRNKFIIPRLLVGAGLNESDMLYCYEAVKNGSTGAEMPFDVLENLFNTQQYPQFTALLTSLRRDDKFTELSRQVRFSDDVFRQENYTTYPGQDNPNSINQVKQLGSSIKKLTESCKECSTNQSRNSIRPRQLVYGDTKIDKVSYNYNKVSKRFDCEIKVSKYSKLAVGQIFFDRKQVKLEGEAFKGLLEELSNKYNREHMAILGFPILRNQNVWRARIACMIVTVFTILHMLSGDLLGSAIQVLTFSWLSVVAAESSSRIQLSLNNEESNIINRYIEKSDSQIKLEKITFRHERLSSPKHLPKKGGNEISGFWLITTVLASTALYAVGGGLALFTLFRGVYASGRVVLQVARTYSPLKLAQVNEVKRAALRLMPKTSALTLGLASQKSRAI